MSLIRLTEKKRISKSGKFPVAVEEFSPDRFVLEIAIFVLFELDDGNITQLGEQPGIGRAEIFFMHGMPGIDDHIPRRIQRVWINQGNSMVLGIIGLPIDGDLIFRPLDRQVFDNFGDQRIGPPLS